MSGAPSPNVPCPASDPSPVSLTARLRRSTWPRDRRQGARAGLDDGEIPGPDSVSSRPGTVEAADLALRVFAGHLIEADPTCTLRGRRRPVTTSSPTSSALAARPGKDAASASVPAPSATSSGWCAPSSSASSSGTTPTPREGPDLRRRLPQGRRAAAALFGRPDRRQVHGRPGQGPQPAPTPHRRAPGPHRACGPASSAAFDDDAVFRLERHLSGCASPSASSTTTARSRCTRSSSN